MNVMSIAQQHINNNNINQTQNLNTDFQDELNIQQSGKWKNHSIEWLSPSQNQALNNKLEELGITSDEEIYKIKSQMEATMITYKSLGVTNPYIYIESHIKSLELGQERKGLNDTDKNVLEVLYAIVENDLENPSIENKFLYDEMNKLIYGEKNKVSSRENSEQLQTKSQASEYVSFQNEIELSNRNNALSLSV